MGAALQHTGQLAEAVDSYDQALKLKPSSAELYSNMGVACHDLGDVPRAIRSFNTALLLLPRGFGEAHFNLGRSLEHMKRKREAVSQYHLALAAKPVYPEAQCANWHLQASLADWRQFRTAARQLRQLARRTPLQLAGSVSCPSVWDAMAYSFLTAHDVLHLAVLRSKEQELRLPAPRPFSRRMHNIRPSQLSVAFVSVHACLLLIFMFYVAV
eukprot:TRINITY_DN57095_c0_g1_i1.p1 TRINITY_DN57095_c0_g1~~TRINITY_DN57095_c0_g1_i1.p1  ORF type:complete len:213 (-),score=18.54 TRINITY_DN57095_c0_g1_i1:322-960(-)